jgi:carbonic anhydrase
MMRAKARITGAAPTLRPDMGPLAAPVAGPRDHFGLGPDRDECNEPIQKDRHPDRMGSPCSVPRLIGAATADLVAAPHAKNKVVILEDFGYHESHTKKPTRRRIVMQSKTIGAAAEESQDLSRRTFLKLTSGAALTGVFGVNLSGSLVYADALGKEKRDKMTPDEILAAFKRGNKNFSKGLKTSRNYLSEQKATAKGQYPLAVVLSCIDSRAPAETIMDLGIGDIFNARVAGNIANDDILGSMEFSCKLAGTKVVLVMGHSACGAIKGAIDNTELGNLTGLLAKIKPAVKATQFKGELSSKNAAYVDAVAQKNVELTITDIRKRSPVLADLESKGTIKIAGAMYNLETAMLNFLA